MPCYAPWVPAGASHKRPVACGQCIGCRLEYSRQWAVRIMHEAQMHESNAFVTLTYKDAPLSLVYSDFQLFMRRLRRTEQVRFFMSGEYGEQYARPHFHAILFGLALEKDEYLGKSESGFRIYRSDALSELWPLGFSSFGDVTFESAAYVARYVVKKVTGDLAEAHYAGRKPEFAQMSRKPGIGSTWLDKYWSDVFPQSKVVVRGVESNAPRFYRKEFRKRFPLEAERVMYEQMEEVVGRIGDNTPDRVKSKEVVKRAQLGMLKRKL